MRSLRPAWFSAASPQILHQAARPTRPGRALRSHPAVQEQVQVPGQTHKAGQVRDSGGQYTATVTAQTLLRARSSAAMRGSVRGQVRAETAQTPLSATPHCSRSRPSTRLSPKYGSSRRPSGQDHVAQSAAPPDQDRRARATRSLNSELSLPLGKCMPRAFGFVALAQPGINVNPRHVLPGPSVTSRSFQWLPRRYVTAGWVACPKCIGQTGAGTICVTNRTANDPLPQPGLHSAQRSSPATSSPFRSSLPGHRQEQATHHA